MKIIKTYFNKEVLVINTKQFHDKRGFFTEFYNKNNFKKIGLTKIFKQDNFSLSKKKYTFRGIHLQKKPYRQAKLVRVVIGKVIDLIIDLRKNSKTFGNYKKVILSDKNNDMVYIPEDFGHAFLTLTSNTMVNYKVTDFYSPESEITINYKDNDLNLDFAQLNNKKFIVSKKDLEGISLNEFKK